MNYTTNRCAITRRFLLAGLSVLFLSGMAARPAGAAASFQPISSLSTARGRHTATLLPNGKLLVVGGQNTQTGNLASSELYDPALGSWAFTGNLVQARYGHSATLLPNGKVLIVGGAAVSGNSVSTVEVYDPATGNWSQVASLSISRRLHSATLLRSGKVLVVGGFTNTNVYTASAELYDPGSDSWTTIQVRRLLEESTRRFCCPTEKF